MLGIPSYGRNQNHNALLASPKECAQGETGELDLRICLESARVARFKLSPRSRTYNTESTTDRMVHVDVNVSIAVSIQGLRVFPEIGIWL